MIDYSSLHRASSNPVDILKPIFQFIDNQQQKQQQGLLEINAEETEQKSDNPIQLASTQQQHVTSTRTTGISFISNGVQMQFINQESSTTTVYPQSQSTSVPNDSPPRSDNSLSIEVHGLEMKYLEDDQLAAAIECGQQSQTPRSVDKSLSFGTQDYLQKYGLFAQTKSPQE